MKVAKTINDTLKRKHESAFEIYSIFSHELNFVVNLYLCARKKLIMTKDL